jgi:3-oxoacyl-[acyl-carrier protein] reductase
MNLGLANKRVLVTGSSRGIGLAIAKKFLEEGAKVCIVSRGSNELFNNEKELQNNYGKENVFASTCDCTSVSDLYALQQEIQFKWSGLDIVISNVGDGRSTADVIPNDKQWDKIWSINFESSLFTAREFLPMLRKSETGGCLLFVSSIVAMEAFGAPVDYSTAKTAIIALAKNIARKLAKEVRVNVLAPGNVFFPGGSWDEKIKQDKGKVASLLESTVPMNRFGTPEEMADAAIFLCSDRARFITGATLVVDGGQTVRVC